jgi:hypothetical protein
MLNVVWTVNYLPPDVRRGAWRLMPVFIGSKMSSIPTYPPAHVIWYMFILKHPQLHTAAASSIQYTAWMRLISYISYWGLVLFWEAWRVHVACRTRAAELPFWSQFNMCMCVCMLDCDRHCSGQFNTTSRYIICEAQQRQWVRWGLHLRRPILLSFALTKVTVQIQKETKK